ncbi:MAG: hypothetical protein SVV80_08035 [Planctomycetota bacterium]|nr:hypothetical protein [Planctomycetota bacterium]
MKSKVIWFTVGIVVGIGSLLIAIQMLPEISPAQAGAAQSPTQLLIETKQIRLIKNMNASLKELNACIKQVNGNFTEPSSDAKKAALKSDLQTLRSQLELYKIQHQNKAPHLDENGKLDTANFVARFVSMTDKNGKIINQGSSVSYGPYLAKFPANPFVYKNGDSVSFGTQDPATGDGKTGWYFNINTGKLSANDSEHNGL